MSSTRHIPIDEAGPTVRDVMLREARTVTPDTPLAQARETFANPKVKLLLVADGDAFLGTLDPADLPQDGEGPIAPLVRADTPRLAPGDPVSAALELVAATGLRRIPVVDSDERLQGLVCFNGSRSAFCASP